LKRKPQASAPKKKKKGGFRPKGRPKKDEGEDPLPESREGELLGRKVWRKRSGKRICPSGKKMLARGKKRFTDRRKMVQHLKKNEWVEKRGKGSFQEPQKGLKKRKN